MERARPGAREQDVGVLDLDGDGAGQRETAMVRNLAGVDGGEPAAGLVELVGGTGERLVVDGEVGRIDVELRVLALHPEAAARSGGGAVEPWAMA
jgi:hypothetical protein